MEIKEFERTVKNVLNVDESGLFSDELSMFMSADGCLSAQFNRKSIPCEGVPWDLALDIIIDFITQVDKRKG